MTMSDRKPSFHLMPPGIQTQIRNNSRSISGVSGVSVASSAVSDFLEEKIKSHDLELEYLRTYQAGLQAARDTGDLPERDLLDQLGETIDRFEAVSNESTVLKRQRTILEQDLEDEAGGTKRQRGNDDEPDVTFLERAYTDTIVPRVMNASGKQRKSRFDQNAFEKDVLMFYEAKREDGLVFCHLTGWKPAELVKAAHLVPKCLSQEQVSYLFGAKEIVLSDARNGMPLRL